MSNNWLIILSILGWGIGGFFYKLANINIHPMIVSAIITCVYLILIPLAFQFISFDKTINLPGVIFALLGAICVAVASISSFYALRTGEAGTITVLGSLYPGLTLMLSVLFLGEQMSFKKALGIVLALGSAYLFGSK